MALRDWIIESGQVATATPATFATLNTKNKETVATVATVIVASGEKTNNMDTRSPVSIIDGLHPCGLCGGNLFNEGSRGGYFCTKCQTIPDGATVARIVRGLSPRDNCHLDEPNKITKDILGDNPGWHTGHHLNT